MGGHQELIRKLVMVQQKGFRWVGMLPEVHAEYMNLETRWRGRLDRCFEKFGIPNTTLPAEQFASEGRHPTGGPNSKEVQLYAFKAYQTRLYGVLIGVQRVQTFIGLTLVTNKKQNKADQNLLRRIVKSYAQYVD
jgi:hypothetical protein